MSSIYHTIFTNVLYLCLPVFDQNFRNVITKTKKQVASNHVDRSQWFVSKAGDLDEWNPGETCAFSGGWCADRPTIKPLCRIGGMFGGVGWPAMNFKKNCSNIQVRHRLIPPNSKVVGDLQRSGIKRSWIASPGSWLFLALKSYPSL